MNWRGGVYFPKGIRLRENCNREEALLRTGDSHCGPRMPGSTGEEKGVRSIQSGSLVNFSARGWGRLAVLVYWGTTIEEVEGGRRRRV